MSKEARRRREDNMVEIRKEMRDEDKKRHLSGPPQQLPQFPAVLPSQTGPAVDMVRVMVEGVSCDDDSDKLKAFVLIRNWLSAESPTFNEVIKYRLIPLFVKLLRRYDHHPLQIEAAWALTIVASGTSVHTAHVLRHGAVPMLVKLLSISPNEYVREQALWALGNVAADSPICRNHVLIHGAMMPLLAQLSLDAKLSMLKAGSWTLSNLCRGKPPPSFELVRPALPVLRELLLLNEEEVLTNVCWALSYLSDGTNDRIQAVIESGVCKRLVHLLLHPSPSVLAPALSTVGNIVTGDDSHRQFVIDNRVLPVLRKLLTQSHKKSIEREVCWIISNITAGNIDQIQAVIQENIVLQLVQFLQNAEYDVKKEAAWAIFNATRGGSPEQIRILVNQGCIKPLCDLLICSDPWVVTVCLDGLENILKVGGESDKENGLHGGINTYAQMIHDLEGWDKIENLQSHDNNEICQKAAKILENYWVKGE